MDGSIVAFDDEAQAGVVATRDGQRYPFALADWRGRGLPGPGIKVRFDIRDERAVHVLNQPVKQQRAATRVPASGPAMSGSAPEPGAAQRRRYAHWAIAAIVTAMLGLFFDILAPVLGLIATLCALLGLRQVRRDPQRYKGRGFCWAAIALALVIATLSLLVEPAPEPRVSQSHPVPDNRRAG